MFSPEKPYNELPELPPAQASVETVKTLKACTAAARELAELKGAGDLIPNQSVLLQAITMQEARSSSEIEQIFTTNDKLFRSSEVDEKDPHTKEVKQYQRALWHGYEEIKKRPMLTISLFEELVQIIKGNTAGVRHGEVSIAGSTSGKIYTPPVGEDVIREKLKNFEEFIHNEYDYDDNQNKDRIDPLIKMAIMHYQFEAIHPFSDGNGRTGRLINILYLVMQDLLDSPVLYLSRYITEHKDEYYSNLRNVTEEKDWETWIVYMLNCVEEMARYTKNKIIEIHAAMKESTQEIQEKFPKMKRHRDLIDVIYENPYCRIQDLESRDFGTRKTCSKYLHSLSKVGMLELHEEGKTVSFINSRFLEILNN